MDTVFYNGIIHTIDSESSVKEAIGIKGSKIAFVGSNAEAEKIKANKRIDLKGQLMLPGFTDSHLHALDYAFSESSVKLNDCTSIEEIIERGREFLKSWGPRCGWILGRGWDQNRFVKESRFLTREDLDKISSDYPLLYSRVCLHVASVNSIALEKILAMEEAKPLMKYIDAEKGILRESAAFLYTNLLQSMSVEEIEDLISLAHRDLNRQGITGVNTTDFLAVTGNDWEKVIEAYKSMEKQGKMSVRTYEQCIFNDIAAFRDFLNKGYVTGKGSDMFRIGPLKLLADGSLGARTALLKEPYADDPATCGFQVFDEAALGEFFKAADEHNMQIAIHGIGDKSIEISADLLNELNGKRKGNPLRHGIIHAQITNPEVLEKLRKGDLLAYIQPVFINSDMEIVEKRIGKERMNRVYAWKTMRDMGIKTSGGSDAPVESFNILENVYFAVTRKNMKGQPEGGWLPEEKLTVDEAVRLFTIDSAYPSFDEKKRGSLEVGKYADMVVLDRNIYEIPPEEIKDAKVVCTIMDGRLCYGDNLEV